MFKKKLLFIATGGTFASVKGADGLSPGFDVNELLSFLPEAKEVADIDCMQLCNLDSTNIHPKYWTQIAQTVADAYDKYDGFIVSHGTDTMQFTAAALSFALQGLLKPVVLTGSVYPIGEEGTDAKMNFMDAVYVASSAVVKEVCICFHHEIIKGTRARKVTNEATKITNEKMGVYSSINLHLVGTVDVGKVIGDKIYFTRNGYPKESQLALAPLFDVHIGYLKLYPGLEASILDGFRQMKAVVIEAFGPGNIPFEYSNWLEKIKEFTQAGIPIFVTTQNPFGEVDMEKYQVGQKALAAGAVSCHDMLPETALVKLMWICGNHPDADRATIETLFMKNVAGEIVR